ncbi:hypothetical protein Mapa_005266 [Marchantia paleacea]|nr:hypothetical protein Mapa_005266 [Marchantia paleacea]
MDRSHRGPPGSEACPQSLPAKHLSSSPPSPPDLQASRPRLQHRPHNCTQFPSLHHLRFLSKLRLLLLLAPLGASSSSSSSSSSCCCQ